MSKHAMILPLFGGPEQKVNAGEQVGDAAVQSAMPLFIIWLAAEHATVAVAEQLARTAQQEGVSKHVVVVFPQAEQHTSALAALSEVRLLPSAGPFKLSVGVRTRRINSCCQKQTMLLTGKG
jgi:type IV pilus biogenesis protein CpaD/CtpE